MNRDTGPVGPLDATLIPRFSGPTTFARLPASEAVDDVAVAVVGVPFDGGTSYRPGARFGPNHIRQSSRLLRPYNPAQDVSPFASVQVADAGDLACNPFNIAETLTTIESGIGALLTAGTVPVILGGDHTLSLPVLRSMHTAHGPVAVVHFDAHLDTWDTYFGEPYTHGTPFRRAAEEGLLDPAGCVHVGIRGPLYSGQDLWDDQRLGFQAVTSDEVGTDGVPATVERIRRRTAGRPVYLSMDIDVLDPAHAPGTGTPEAGGLSSRELLQILRGLSEDRLVGVDVVEVSPAYDHAEITGIAAAHVVYEAVSLLARQLTKPDPA